MGRGKKIEIDEYITNIAPYLEVGCSLNEACLHGLTPYTTVIDYYNNDESVRKKIDRLKNVSILKARESVCKGMTDNGDLALRYLERKKRDEFSLRTETDLGNKDDKPLKIEDVNETNVNDVLLTLLNHASVSKGGTRK